MNGLRLPRAAVLTAAAVSLAFTLGAAPPAHARTAVQGIADSGAQTFRSPLWRGLNVRHVRAIVPYDIAQRPKTDARRKRFEAWLAGAEAAGASRNVGLARIVDKNRRGYGRAPNERTYRTALRAFVATYGPRVNVIGPWNEPNYRPTDGSRAVLPAGRPYYLDNPNGRCSTRKATAANCGPRMAAYYYRWATRDCPTCRLAAGEFAGTQSSAYVQRYKLHLGRHRPTLWSVHNYADVIRYQVRHNLNATELRMFLREIFCTRGHHCSKRTNWRSGHLWIGATGAYYQLDCRTHKVPCDPGRTVHVLGQNSQCRAAAFVNRLPDLSPRITRIYYYTFTDGRSGDNTGIVNSSGTKQRKAYRAIRDRARTCRALPKKRATTD